MRTRSGRRMFLALVIITGFSSFAGSMGRTPDETGRVVNSSQAAITDTGAGKRYTLAEGLRANVSESATQIPREEKEGRGDAIGQVVSSSEATLNGKPLSAGEWILDGDTVSTDVTGRAVVKLWPSNQATIEGNSSASFTRPVERIWLQLQRGTIDVENTGESNILVTTAKFHIEPSNGAAGRIVLTIRTDDCTYIDARAGDVRIEDVQSQKSRVLASGAHTLIPANTPIIADLPPLGTPGAPIPSAPSPHRPAPQGGAKVITVWKVGNPYTGAAPGVDVPRSLELAAEKLGYGLKAKAFRIQDFAGSFFRAFANRQPPDILVFNNSGVLDGVSTPLGRFRGVGTDPAIHAALVEVTESLPAFGGRGWEYLIRTSPNFEAAQALALRPPECAPSQGAALPPDLGEITVQSAGAYLENSPSLRNFEDPDRLHTDAARQKERHVQTVKACGYFGTDHLAFVPAITSYTSPGTIGWVSSLMVFRKQSDHWRLLAASTDPVSNKTFVGQMPALVGLITKPWTHSDDPEPPSLLSPQDAAFPAAAPGARFGNFIWHPSPSGGEVAEIVEFANHNDARLLAILFSGPAPATEHCSAGTLGTAGGIWKWRVWSISESGGVSFSPSRHFTQ